MTASWHFILSQTFPYQDVLSREAYKELMENDLTFIDTAEVLSSVDFASHTETTVLFSYLINSAKKTFCGRQILLF